MLKVSGKSKRRRNKNIVVKTPNLILIIVIGSVLAVGVALGIIYLFSYLAEYFG